MTRPLADLHRHLDGSLRTTTLEELADQVGVALPERVGFEPGMGLGAALAQFDLTLSLLQHPEAVARVAAEMCEDADDDGVTTLEIRFAPQLHRGAEIETVVDAALDGIGGRAGLILCGLYGEPPEMLEHFVDIAEPRSGVVGIDLAGGPQSSDRWTMESYAPAFARARDLGLGRTVHAGEGRPPQEIRGAIELLNAQRIGHGTTLLGDPAVADLVLERSIVIEACPTSNVHTGAIAAVDEHPLPRWLELGIEACINTDNTLFSRVDSASEHRNAARIPGMTEQMLERAIETGHAAAFRRH